MLLRGTTDIKRAITKGTEVPLSHILKTIQDKIPFDYDRLIILRKIFDIKILHQKEINFQIDMPLF